MLFLGIDVGSSSVKLAVLDGDTGKPLASTQYPDTELDILSPQSGWAEQQPETWWECIKQGCTKLFAKPGVDAAAIEAIGISYQMHGLVLVDQQQQVIRPAIIWCDSRAVPHGDAALSALGKDYCFDHLLNSPGNFTAAKLRWVQQNEPENFARIHKMMLPGDYVAMRLSGEINSTASGLSEGTLWDFKEQQTAKALLQHWDIPESLLPDLVPSMGEQCRLSATAAGELDLREGVKISYRGGDQPNNALSLNVLNPGEVAATAGTSGVIYGVTDQPAADLEQRVNTFLHVTNTQDAPRNGVLVCVNGAGRSFSWLRQILSVDGKPVDYVLLNTLASEVAVGSEGLTFLPFGNGAERIFQNRVLGSHLQNIDLNRHSLGHIVRATQEGIVFALNQGFEVLKSLGGSCDVVRVAKGNMFLSEVFAKAFANTTQAAVEVYETDGAEGAARGAAIGCGYYASAREAFGGLTRINVIEPESGLITQYQQAYNTWLEGLPV
ncbi:xylulokinase [Alteromonadaceae bacterium Bs31]|nr:xylulokinase [Alteromonadaceae bacterium Bs31]